MNFGDFLTKNFRRRFGDFNKKLSAGAVLVKFLKSFDEVFEEVLMKFWRSFDEVFEEVLMNFW